MTRRSNREGRMDGGKGRGVEGGRVSGRACLSGYNGMSLGGLTYGYLRAAAASPRPSQ